MSRATWMTAAALAVLVCSGVGCATILVGPSQTVSIESSPPGATAVILPDGGEVVTPTTVSLARKRSHTVRFRLDGHRPMNGYIDPLPGGARYGNIVVGGVIGILVDLSSGAAWTLRPDPLHAVLEPISARPAPFVEPLAADTPGNGGNIEP